MTPRDTLQASAPRLRAFADYLAAEGDDALAAAARRAAEDLEQHPLVTSDLDSGDHHADTFVFG